MWKIRANPTRPDPQPDWPEPVFNPLKMTRDPFDPQLDWPDPNPDPHVLPCLPDWDIQSFVGGVPCLLDTKINRGQKMWINTYHPTKEWANAKGLVQMLCSGLVEPYKKQDNQMQSKTFFFFF